MKIEGGVSGARKEVTVVKTLEVKTTNVRNESPVNNGAVIAKKNDGNFQANMRQSALYAQTGTVAAKSAPTITPDEARQKADEIIKNNGGRDNLNTDNAGRDLADIARQNPADAQAVAREIYKDDKIKDEDRDEIAQSFTRALSDSDLNELSRSREGQELLKETETNLLDYPVHEDESADANRIRTALDNSGIFLGSEKGMYFESVNPVSIQDDPNASPEEVAAYVKSHPSSTYEPNAGRYAYLDALQAHKDDAQWLGKFYSALGSELSGQLISETVQPSSHQMPGGGGTDPEYAIRQADLVRHSLETMQKGGDINQDGMNALVNSMPKNPYVATEIFAKSTNAELKQMFVNAAVNNGDDSWDAGAMHVLNTMPPTRQSQILNGLGEKLNPFIEGAMNGQKEMFSFHDSVKYGIYGTSVNEDLLTKETYGGVEKLLATANRTAGYNGSTFEPAPFSDALKLKLLDAVSSGLTNEKAFSNLSGNTRFKDELSRLTVSQHEAYITNALNADGGATGEDLSSEFKNKYSKLLQMTLFTPPLGEKSADLMKYIDGTFKGIGEDLKNLNDQQFEAKYGRNRAAMARAFGEMTGVFFKALDEGLTKVKTDAAKAAEIMDPIFKLFDFGLGKAGPIGKTISTALSLTGASESAKKAIKEKIKNGEIKEALEDMKDLGVDISKLAEQLYEEVHNNLLPNATAPNGTYRNPDGTSVTIKEAWQNGYDNVEGAPKTK